MSTGGRHAVDSHGDQIAGKDIVGFEMDLKIAIGTPMPNVAAQALVGLRFASILHQNPLYTTQGSSSE